LNKKITIIASFLGLVLLFGVGYLAFRFGFESGKAKMTASQVCEYVNQALPNEYISYSSPQNAKLPLRYKIQYTALDSHYDSDGKWIVNVDVTAEPEMFSNGGWEEVNPAAYDLIGVKTLNKQLQYYFDEKTGSVTRK
jgi:hypothetical protein